MLGIIIGIAAIIAIVSTIKGTNEQIKNNLIGAGNNTVKIQLSKAHIGFLGEYYCNEVIAESKKLLERRRKQQPAGFRPCKGGEAS